ncbi:MAG TPA: penicillin acylase family protein [Longimicrobiales bacterium]|nr:penicillin acylase family protein [Longimicrobiales bacterium]
MIRSIRHALLVPPLMACAAALLLHDTTSAGAQQDVRQDAQQDEFAELARRALAPIEGTVTVAGLQDTVEIIRDRWGVPHIYARNTDDLFFAQGFVHGQDRLWQMDMYRRMYEGRMAEVMGEDYVAHDRLARLVRYRGPLDDREWTTYHPEGRRIFQAFADGVNAWIDEAGDNLPVEFVLTGLRPERWSPEVSVLRTQTAMPLGDARAELNLARSVARYGAGEANRRARPSPWRELEVPAGLDVGLIDDAVLAGLAGMRTGTPRPPLLPRYQRLRDALPSENRGAQEDSPGSNNWAVSGWLTASGQVMMANDPHRNVANPSIRYIVHLNAPGWDVIGATEAPLPGVAIGHNGRIAWGLTIVGTDQSDVYVERLNPANLREVEYRGRWEPLRVEVDTIVVKDGDDVVIEHLFSRHGPMFHVDSTRHLGYALRSTMHEPGTAGYLGALRYNEVDDCVQFLDEQVYYNAPTENMVCGDVHGNIAWQASALSPRRPNWHGRLPVPAHTGEYEWDGFRDDLPRELNPERGWIATANHDIHPPHYDPPLFFKAGPQDARMRRLAQLFSWGSKFTLDDMKAMQMDAWLPAAAADLPLFRGWTGSDPELERGRAMLAAWDAHRRRDSAPAALYNYVARHMTDAMRNASPGPTLQQALELALSAGLADLRDAQGRDPAQWRWGRIHHSEFPHALVRAYDIPGVERDGGSGTVAATGATYRQIIDFADLDGSLVTNAPGQSAQPGSPFYANLVDNWGRGEYFPLAYSRQAVERNAAHRLVLVPR